MVFLKSKQFNEICVFLFNETALQIAIENENDEIVEILLSNPRINVNIPSIFQLILIQFFLLIFLSSLELIF